MLLMLIMQTVSTIVLRQNTYNNSISNNSVVILHTTMSNKVSESFTQHEVVPDVIPIAPSQLVQIDYNGVAVNLGNEFTPTQVKDQPTNIKWPTKPDVLYTIIMTDPDAPNRANPTVGEVNHWLIANIPGNDLNKADVLTQYVGSGPPKDSGLHRYVFLVYEQKGPLLDAEHGIISNTTRAGRLNWKAAKFVEKHQLGNPIAGNFYQAEYDDYVPILHSQFT